MYRGVVGIGRWTGEGIVRVNPESRVKGGTLGSRNARKGNFA